mmetsp:Transcript_2163/g.2127  ORF Transcript_2163/g.2127 Transcript_2163/m.2127 type:complete len:426 (+) Transcript_2163:18-1295(+)|eukprot:CAMPEP_0174821524 /NCGR_PEP_ID=MMETSP1107-20130205/9035_1 /TAXON_ID=36770 /ORGANISM="Paraphysomonas vestita, Strain GFlagA" /LENGTH=425 /DNA_ID=CAMNT_0016038677 /DNA_START=18 /DNA_END=1295 /DNA_ORIENTATION=-
MGVYLSTPNTEINSEEGEGYDIKYAVGEIQGWRKNMEDAHISTTNLAPLDHSELDGDNVSVFGVFDGHGGKEVAKFCQVYFLRELTQIPEFCERKFDLALKRCFHRMDDMIEDEQYDFQLQQFRKIPNPSDRKASITSNESDHEQNGEDGRVSPPITAGKKLPLSEAMALFQKLLNQQQEANKLDNVTLTPLSQTSTPQPTPPLNESSQTNETEQDGRERKESLASSYSSAATMMCRLPDHRITAGCTACVALKHGNELYVANAGDSRAVLCRGDGTAYALSNDHKPNDKTELDRIIAAGGFVNHVGRVNGNLNLSRAIGDLKYKQSKHITPPEQIITADPDVTMTTLLPTDKFIIIACDGIWDCFTNQEACNFISTRLDQGKNLSKIIEEVFEFCVSVDPRTTGGIGGDNMTCIIIKLNDETRK